MKVNGVNCLYCKGRLLCGLKKCKVLERYNNIKKVTSNLKGTSFSGSSPPSLFVSWTNYPNVSLAPLSSPVINSNASLLDNPEKWFGLPEGKIISFREQLISSRKSFDVTSASTPSRTLSEIQEMTMSIKPVEVGIELKKKPIPRLSFDSFSAPLGPTAPLKKFSLEENPRIERKVDYIVGDTDLKAIEGVKELYKENFPVHFLYKLLSGGLLGVKRKRRLTPTRWAITAIDSQLSIELIKKIKSFKEISSIQLFTSSFLDNHFFVLLIPGEWSFEQLEAWKPGGSWTLEEKEPSIIADHEFFKGRKKYADKVAGAYYAARLAVAEYLEKERRQATAIVFREIGEDYSIPLGVWVIRENMRNALKKKPLTFSDLSLALKFLELKLSIPLKNYEKKSRLLDALKNQKKITDFS